MTQPSTKIDGMVAERDTHGMPARLDAERDDEQMRVKVELGAADPLGQLRGLRAADKQLEVWQREAIARAREHGASWSQIGDALGITKQAAWKLYNEDVRELLTEIRQRSGLSDEQAQRLADEERAARARP